MAEPGAPRIRPSFSSTAWDLAFREVRAEIRNSRAGRVRVELWVNALLNDGDDGDDLPDVGPSNVISLCQARLELTRQLVSLIDARHQTWRRYPVLGVLAESCGWEPEALGEAYLRHLRRDLEALRALGATSKRTIGSAVALRIVEGDSEGP